MSVIDPISRDVFQSQVHGIANEMCVALRRASFSSIIWDMYDFSCGLFTPEGDMIAQGDTIPAQLGIMSTAIRYIFKEFPLQTWKPGDVLVCNDPYKGCTHTMDICLFSPVYHRDEIVAITSTIAHHMDVGGAVAGSGSPDLHEVFGEGIILPPMKLVREGVADETIVKIIRNNVRLPDAVMGDLRAQIAGCRIGERRLQGLAARYGSSGLSTHCREILDYAERYTRRAIRAIDDGVSQASIWVEDDVTTDDPYKLHAKVSVVGDQIEVDVTQSDDQRAFGLNNPECSTLSMIHYAVKCVTTPELPQNEGCVRPVKIKMRKGSILNPNHPAAVGERHHTQQALADVVLKALVPLRPDVSSAGSQVSFSSFVLSGLDDRPVYRDDQGNAPYYIVSDIVGGGMGASSSADGMHAVDTHGGNCALISAEVMESIAPVRVRRTELIPDSGGRGEFRGGLGISRDFELLAKSAVLWGDSQQTRELTAAWGYAGGGPGGLAGFVLNPGTENEEVLKARIPKRTLKRGDVLRVIGSGGGGWGNSAVREPAAEQHDLRQGYVNAARS